MILTISGYAGSGKSTVAKLVAQKLQLAHHSSGDFMRELADERHISILEISKLAETDRSIDEELDQRQIELGRTEDDFIIDGRLSFHFIPNSIKIFLDCNFDVRADRVFSDNIRREHNVTLKSTKENIKVREDSEQKRYKEYYNVDPYDMKYYDLVIDTTEISAEEVADRIVEHVKEE